MSLTARASFVTDSESQIYQSKGDLDPFLPVNTEENRHSPTVLRKKQQQKAVLTIEKRLERLQNEIHALGEEFNTGKSKISSFNENPVEEMQKILENAQKETGKNEKIQEVLSGKSDVLCSLTAVLPENESDLATLATEIEAKISNLEGIVGKYHPSFHYFTVNQGISGSQNAVLRVKKEEIAGMDDRAENISSELDVVNYRFERLFSESDSRVIEEVYDLYEEINTVKLALPVLLTRLNDLKRVHEEGGEFKQRLAAVQTTLQEAETRLGSTGVEELIGTWNEFKAELKKALGELQGIS